MVLQKGHGGYSGVPTSNGTMGISVPRRITRRSEASDLRPSYWKGGDPKIGRLMNLLFDKLGLILKIQKCEFQDTEHLEILEILVDKKAANFSLPLSKATEVETSTGHIIRYAFSHHISVRGKDIQKLAGLTIATTPAVMKLHLRLPNYSTFSLRPCNGMCSIRRGSTFFPNKT